MMDYKEIPDSKTVEITVGEKITVAEYDETIKRLKETMNKWDKFNVLELVTDFKGIEPLALWKDIKFALKEFGNINNKLSKCAVVADAKWIEIVSNLFDPFVKAEIKFFPISEEDKARDWLRA